jgi:hypothetical protein
VNKRIKKKIEKRYGYKKYQTYKIIIPLIKSACTAMGVPLHMAIYPTNSESFRFTHYKYNTKIIKPSSEPDGKILPTIMEVEDNNIPIIMPINKEG